MQALPLMTRSRAGHVAVVVALLAIGILRAASIVFADPLLAVANNYDMVRVQACIDAYPMRDASIPPTAASYRAPLSRYHFIRGVGATCFVTSEDLFAFAAWPEMWLESRTSADGGFTIRWIGLLQLSALMALAIAVSVALARRDRPWLAVAHALVFALVLCDPAVTLYFNTFYAESAAVFAAWLLVAALTIGLARPSVSGIAWPVLAGLGATLLAVSKVQHVLTPLLALSLLLAGRWVGLRVARPVLVALALGALVGASVQGLQMRAGYTVTMGHANLINSLFGAVLPNAKDAKGLVGKLGLPADCASHSGENWFTPGMAERQRCPEVFELRRTRFLAVLLGEPGLVARVWIGGVARMQPWIPRYLGLVESEVGGRLPASQPSLSSVLDRIPGPGWLALVLTLIPLAMVAARSMARRAEHAVAAATLLLGTLPALLLLIAVLGDGYGDTAKQSHLATTMLLAGWVCIAMAAVRACIEARWSDACAT